MKIPMLAIIRATHAMFTIRRLHRFRSRCGPGENLVSPQGLPGIIESGLGVADEEVDFPEFHVRHSDRSFNDGWSILAGLGWRNRWARAGARPLIPSSPGSSEPPLPEYPRNYMKYSRKPTFLVQRLIGRNGQNQWDGLLLP